MIGRGEVGLRAQFDVGLERGQLDRLDHGLGVGMILRLHAGVGEQAGEPPAHRLGRRGHRRDGFGRRFGRQVRLQVGDVVAPGGDPRAVERGLHLHRPAHRHQVQGVQVDHRAQHRRRRGDVDPVVGGQEQRLLGGAAAHQGVDDDPLALEVGLAPQLHGAGGLHGGPGVQPLQHLAAAEIVEADVEGDPCDRGAGRLAALRNQLLAQLPDGRARQTPRNR